jgi:hypothetical protein
VNCDQLIEYFCVLTNFDIIDVENNSCEKFTSLSDINPCKYSHVKNGIDYCSFNDDLPCGDPRIGKEPNLYCNFEIDEKDPEF